MYRERERKKRKHDNLRNQEQTEAGQSGKKKKIVKNTNLLWKIHVKETIISMRSEKCRIVDS